MSPAVRAARRSFAQFREMRQAMAGANLRFAAPAALRSRIEAAIPAPVARAPRHRGASLLQGLCVRHGAVGGGRRRRRVRGGAFGSGSSRLLGDVVSAHLRSLQAEHLTDVRVDRSAHVVKPWFNGKLAVAPPVIDLTAQGFTLVGGRLDYHRRQAGGGDRLSARRPRHQSVRGGGRERRSHGRARRGGARLQHAALERSGPALHRDQRHRR